MLVLENQEIEIYIALADILFFLGDFNGALKIVIKAKKIYREFAEIEFRLCGLFMILDKEEYSLTHLKTALAIDYEYHSIIKELYPSVYENKRVQEILSSYKKALK